LKRTPALLFYYRNVQTWSDKSRLVLWKTQTRQVSSILFGRWWSLNNRDGVIHSFNAHIPPIILCFLISPLKIKIRISHRQILIPVSLPQIKRIFIYSKKITDSRCHVYEWFSCCCMYMYINNNHVRI
jgi:hypothetical protein